MSNAKKLAELGRHVAKLDSVATRLNALLDHVSKRSDGLALLSIVVANDDGTFGELATNERRPPRKLLQNTVHDATT